MLTHAMGVLATAIIAGWGAGAQAGAIRAMSADGNTCWAVGDAGCVLVSRDAGATWRSLVTTVPANFQSVQTGPDEVWLFGGMGVPGHASGAGMGTILRSADGGKSFQAISPGSAGWLYGGQFSGATGVTFGQANSAAPAGLLRTIDGGRIWSPPAISSLGYLVDGDFLTPRRGYVVGQDHRIISLRNLSEPTFHPPASESKLDLKCVRFSDPLQCWAVGENGRVLRSRTATRPWDPIRLSLPGRALMCADFEALVTPSPESAYVAGGLMGVIPFTKNVGGNWRLLKAPGPGAIHSLLRISRDVLLAAGDGQRIWRSTDAGETWRLVSGSKVVDVLFIVAAGDRSVYPAIVAHARAGCSVAVVYATHLSGRGQTATDQPLRAAAIAAGADGVTTLTEFPSGFNDPAMADESIAQMLYRWSVPLEYSAETEMIHQLAAAIRLYRPTVLAVGPDGADADVGVDARGPAGENHLVAQLAQRAALAAGDESAVGDLAKVNLPPWKVRRVVVGLVCNEQYSPPWQARTRPGRDAKVTFDGLKMLNDSALPLDIQAARASWLLPGAGLLDRPAEVTAYRCKYLNRPMRLFTSMLTDRPRLIASAATGKTQNLVVAPKLRLAGPAGTGALPGQAEMAATDLVAALENARDPNDAAIAADRLVLAWQRLLQAGKLIHADAVQFALMKKSKYHPLGQKLDVIALATTVSSEWQAQLRRAGLPKKLPTKTLERAVEGYARMPAWALTPAGRMLLIRAMLAAGKLPQAKRELRQLAAKPQPLAWRKCALLELGDSVETVQAALKGRTTATALVATGPGTFDGKLDETCWTEALPIPLRTSDPAHAESAPADDPNAPPTPQIIATVSPARYAIFAIRLPRQAKGHWEIDFAIDADRDCWTQIVLHADTRGRRGTKLIVRDGVVAELGKDIWQIRADRSEKEWTMEIAVGLNQFSVKRPAPGAAELWNFQVRATACAAGGTRTPYYLAPQPDGRFLPERYGLFKIPSLNAPVP